MPIVVAQQKVLGPREVPFCSNIDFLSNSAHIRSSWPYSQRVHDGERKFTSVWYLAHINKYIRESYMQIFKAIQLPEHSLDYVNVLSK